MVKQQNNGTFITTLFKTKTTRTLLWTKRGLMVGDKIRAIQALSCTLSTKVNKTRGNSDMALKKCKCKMRERFAYPQQLQT